MELSSITGVLIGLIAILGALTLEGGSVSTIIQPKAALVVLGGTIGAGLINYPLSVAKDALQEAKSIFFEEKIDFDTAIEQIYELANIARQEGSLIIQNLIPAVNDDSLKKWLQLTVDNNDRKILEDLFDAELQAEEAKGLVVPTFFEALGGYAPTFGIVGAVLGLIQVMSSLEDPSQLGYGISTAFVATLYGVGAANLIFLPIAGKLRYRLREKLMLKKIMAQGILCIHREENPLIIREKLLNYVR